MLQDLPAERRVHIRHLLRKSTGELTPREREELLEHLGSSAADLQAALQLVKRHGDLGQPDRVVPAVAERIPASIDNLTAMGAAQVLAAGLSANSYAAIVCQVVPRIHSLRDDAARGRAWPFVERLRGGQRFDRLHRAALDLAVPHHDAAELELGVSLAIAGVREDEPAIGRLLAARAASSGSEALYVWRLARTAQDVELESAVRPEVLKHVDLSVEPDDLAPTPWRLDLQRAVLVWVGDDGPDAAERVSAVMDRARAAHVAGRSWNWICGTWCLGGCELLHRSLLERSLDEDDAPAFATHRILAERLKSGSEPAWAALFRWTRANSRTSPTLLRDLMRGARLPDAPDNEFWTEYLVAWATACASEEEYIQGFEARLADRLPPNLPPRVALEMVLGRRPNSPFPLTSPGELVERILNSPPTPASARALLPILSSDPSLLQDARLAGFTGHLADAATDQLPDASCVSLMSAQAVHTFLALRGATGAAQLRKCIRSGFDRAYPVRWLLEQSWLDAVTDSAFLVEVKSRAREARLLDLIWITEHRADILSRNEALAFARKVLSQWIALTVVPDWLDDLLLERAATTTSEAELRQLVLRFEKGGRRQVLLNALRTRLLEEPGPNLAICVGDLLSTRSAWEADETVELVRELARMRRFYEVRCLIGGRTERMKERLADRTLVVAMHLALARGALRLATERAEVGDSAGVERILTAIANLDPPKPFMPDLRGFGRVDGLNESVRHWVERMHTVAKEGGGKEATPGALGDCLEDLAGPQV